MNLKLPFSTDLRALGARPTEKRLGHFHLDPTELPADLMEFLNARSINVVHCEVFYTPPFARLPIHVDGPVISNVVKLNWCYGAEGSVMNWFRLKDPSKEPPLKTTIIGTRYVQPTAEECVMVYSTKIGRPTLVNVGQPHSVINCTAEDRWVVSVVLSKDGKGLEWEEAMQIFEDVI